MGILSNITAIHRDKESYNHDLVQVKEDNTSDYECLLFNEVLKKEELDQFDEEDLFSYYCFMGEKIRGAVFEPFRIVLLYIMRKRLYDLLPEVLTMNYSLRNILSYSKAYSYFLKLPCIELEYLVNHLDLSDSVSRDLFVSLADKSFEDFKKCWKILEQGAKQKPRQLTTYFFIKKLLDPETKIKEIEAFFQLRDRDDYLQAMHMNRDCITKLLQLVLDYLNANATISETREHCFNMFHKEGKCLEGISQLRQSWQSMERGFTLMYFTYKSLQDKLTENEIKVCDEILGDLKGMQEFIEEMQPLDIVECQDITQERKLDIPEDFFSNKNHCKSLDAKDKLYLSDGRFTDVSKIERFINGLVENGYIDDNYHTKGSLLARLTGRQLNDVNLEKVVWKRDRKCLFYTVQQFNKKVVKGIRNHSGIYDKMNVFFNYDGKLPNQNKRVINYSAEANNMSDKTFKGLWSELIGDES